MNRQYRRYHLGIIFLTLSNCVQAVSIELGMSTALSGPNQYLGRAMYEGMLACFDEVNQLGGVQGQKIHLTVLDDSYQPDSALKNTKQLIDQYKAIAIVGNVGTPTAAKAAPEANAQGVVFYGAYTGADILRKTPPEPFVFNFRASYRQEMEVIIRDILDHGIAPRRIAFFLQDDAYGQAGYEMAKVVLETLDFQYIDELPVTRYQRNSLSIQNAIKSMIYAKPKPEAIIIVGAYKPSAQFIRFTHRIFPEARFYNLSFSGAPALADALAGLYGRIYITQIVPVSSLHIAENSEEQNVIWHEGYLAAHVLVMALKRIQGKIDSNRLREALEALGEFNSKEAGMISFNRMDHQASDYVRLAHLDKTLKWKVIEQSGDQHWKN